jgi:S1-C subfamily serine protease
LKLEFSWELLPNSDHWPFFQRDVPILLLHTGPHDQAHTPYDDAHLINNGGMRRVVRLLFHIASELADRQRPPAFRPAGRHETEETRRRLASRVVKRRSRLGVSWHAESPSARGVRLTRVRARSAAQRAGLRPGDRIIQFAGREIHTGKDLQAAVLSAHNPATAVVTQPENLEPSLAILQLDGRPLRLGITWRLDEAEPGGILLTHVASGSPAAQAGLCVGDRIYQVAGQDFADDGEFAKMVKSLPEPLHLLVERSGQLRTVVLYFQSKPPRQAA